MDLTGHRRPDMRCPARRSELSSVWSLTLLGCAFFPVLVHRPAAALQISSPHSVPFMPLLLVSFTVTCLRRDFHP
jgi:hypothetical protein